MEPITATATPTAQTPAGEPIDKTVLPVTEQNAAPEPKKESTSQDPNKPHKIKVDGKEYFLSTEEALTLAQKGYGADKRFNEAHKIKQSTEQFIHLLKTDPMSILLNPNIGIDFKRLAQDYLKKELDKEMLTPEQRELMEVKEKLKLAEEEKKSLSEKESKERENKLVQHYSAEYEKDIIGALQNSGLPKTRGTVKRMAYYMQKGLEQGVELKAVDVVDLVKSDYIQEHNELYGSTDGDTLLKLFGDPTIKKILEANLKKIKGESSAHVPTSSKPGEGEQKKIPAQSLKLEKDEWRKQLDERVNSL